MNKKAKITLNLSAIAVALAVGAQIYTNHKIDQILQQFPYHFSNQFKIYVEQTERSFFNRDLIFKLESNQEKIDIIHTKLTALPFAITAKSEIPIPLIRQLNSRFNIAIDSNTIISKFSVVGDYLQSNMVTHFRDPTNVSRLLETDLNYFSKTQFIDVQTELNAIQFDSVTNMKDIKGKFVLQPFGDHRYDLVQADIKLGEMTLTDGENNHFSAEKVNYLLNKSFGEIGYDLKVTLNNEKFTFKNINNNLQVDNLQLNLNKFGTPNNITLYEEYNKFTENEFKLQQLVHTTLSYLFDNNKFDSQLAAQKITLENKQNKVNLDKLNWSFNANNQDKKDASFNNQLSIEQITQQNNTEEKTPQNSAEEKAQLNIQGINAEQQISQFNIGDYIKLIENYFPEKNITLLSKTNPQFLEDLMAFVKDNKYKMSTKLNVKSLSVPEKLQSENIIIQSDDGFSSSNNLTNQTLITMDNLLLHQDNMKLSQIKLSFPFVIQGTELVNSTFMCFQQLSLICMNNISAEKSQELINETLKLADIEVSNADFSATLDTLSKPTTAGNITATLTVKSPSLEKISTNKDPLLQKFEASSTKATLSIPTQLVDDMLISHNEINSLKTGSELWQWLKNTIYPTGSLNPYFQLNKENYQLDFEFKENQTFINGKTLDELSTQPANETEQLEEMEKEPEEENAETDSEQTKTVEETIEKIIEQEAKNKTEEVEKPTKTVPKTTP